MDVSALTVLPQLLCPTSKSSADESILSYSTALGVRPVDLVSQVRRQL